MGKPRAKFVSFADDHLLFFICSQEHLRYVATEEGILELTVNIEERKQFPSMAFT